MADLVDAKVIDGTEGTVRELLSGRRNDLDYHQREDTSTESNVVMPRG